MCKVTQTKKTWELKFRFSVSIRNPLFDAYDWWVELDYRNPRLIKFCNMFRLFHHIDFKLIKIM